MRELYSLFESETERERETFYSSFGKRETESYSFFWVREAEREFYSFFGNRETETERGRIIFIILKQRDRAREFCNKMKYNLKE